MVTPKAGIVTIVCALSAAAAAAQNSSIALVQTELITIRELLTHVPQQTGLDGLSAEGKSVFQDVANLAVIVDAQGKWLYRHAGNNRELFDKQGAAGDKAAVLAAMSSPYYNHLAGVNRAAMSNRLGAILSTPTGASEMAALLSEISRPQYPDSLADLIKSQLGEAIVALPADAKGELLADADTGRLFFGAVETAMKFDQRRVASLANASEITDAGKLEALRALFNADHTDSENPGPLVFFEPVPGSRGGELYALTKDDGSGIRIYITKPEGAGAEPAEMGSVMTQDKLKQLWQRNQIKVYAAEPGMGKLMALPKSIIQ